MEFPDLGKQCKMTDCQQLDFLPFTCEYCKQVFCKDHSTPIYHQCPDLPKTSQGSDHNEFKFGCSVPKCSNRELVAVSCDRCKLNFCLQHRHSGDHRCVPDAPKLSEEERLAQEKVLLIAETLGQRSKKKGGRKDPKLAAKVQLMKLKMKAVSVGPTIPPELRLHLLVCLPLKDFTSKNIAVSVDKNWSVGRALDAVCDKAKVPNHNNSSETHVLQLFRYYDGSLLPASSKLQDLVASGGLCDGETIVLEQTERGVVELVDTEPYKNTM